MFEMLATVGVLLRYRQQYFTRTLYSSPVLTWHCWSYLPLGPDFICFPSPWITSLYVPHKYLFSRYFRSLVCKQFSSIHWCLVLTMRWGLLARLLLISLWHTVWMSWSQKSLSKNDLSSKFTYQYNISFLR